MFLEHSSELWRDVELALIEAEEFEVSFVF